MERKRRLRTGIDILVFISSIIFIALLLVVLGYSLQYWANYMEIIRAAQPLDAQIWSLAMLIVVVTILSQWIEGRMRAISRILEGGSNGKGRRR